jgi:cytochrome c-type biogenesis protein CcmH/NrfG
LTYKVEGAFETLVTFGQENLGTISSFGAIQMEMGRYDDAEKAFRQALELEKGVLGPEQPESKFRVGTSLTS